jgi:hypothetical protein
MNPPLSPAILGEIISFGLWMRKEGYRESTIRPCIRELRAIAKRANLLNPESVKSYLASADLSDNRKEKLTHDLSRFHKWKHIHFQKPTYREAAVYSIGERSGPINIRRRLENCHVPTAPKRDRYEGGRGMESTMDRYRL